MPFNFTPINQPVVITTGGEAGQEAIKQYDVLYPAGTYEAGVGNAIAQLVGSTGTTDPAKVKTGLEQLAAVATALAARVQI